jgi:hypothetical protein
MALACERADPETGADNSDPTQHGRRAKTERSQQFRRHHEDRPAPCIRDFMGYHGISGDAMERAGDSALNPAVN